MRRRSFKQLVADYQAMPGGDLNREIAYMSENIPVLLKHRAAALTARRRQRRTPRA